MAVRKKTTAIMNPVQVDTREATDEVLGDKVILSVGRLRRIKGHTVLLKAFAEVKDKLPDWRLVILGEGTERGNLEKIIAAEGLQDRVFLPGVKKNVFALMRQAAVFVFPSFSEGLGNAYMEAMARGLPVLASDCDFGPGEIIQHGENGLLFPPGDAHALAGQLVKLCKDKALREKLGANAREIVKRLDPALIMGEWETLIRSVLRFPAESRNLKPDSGIAGKGSV